MWEVVCHDAFKQNKDSHRVLHIGMLTKSAVLQLHQHLCKDETKPILIKATEKLALDV